jgi:hypothetical protein
LDYNATPAKLKDECKSLFVEQACGGSLQGLKQAKNTWKRWLTYCEESETPPTEATRTQVALWLKSLKSKGKTAPRGALSSLKRACALLGVEMELDCKVVKSQTLCAKAQLEIPAVPFRIKVWMLIEHEAKSSNSFVSALALSWLLLIQGVTRFAHLQRSAYLGEETSYLKFQASSGKERCEGARKPMIWSVPKLMLNGEVLTPLVDEFLEERGKAYEEAEFWLPDFEPRYCDLEKVANLAPHRMGIQRFQRLTAELFKAKGVDIEQVNTFSTYSARRILPTIADAASMSPTERINIGAWTDPKLDKTKKKLTMPDRYAHTALRSKAKAKLKAILAAKLASEGQDVDEDPEWDTIFSTLPKAKALDKAVREYF